MVEFFIGLKHIKERKRQTFIAVISVAIGIIVLSVALGIANGLDNNMIKNILSMTPHIKLSNDSASIYNYLEVAEEIQKIPEVKGVIPKYSTQGIIKYEGDKGVFVSGVLIEGMPETSAKNVIELDKKIIAGKFRLSSLDIMIGKELFNQIGAKIGDKVKIVSPENKEIYLNIVGVFQSGFYDFDTTMVIISLETVQTLSDSDDIASVIDVRLKNVYLAESISKKIEILTGLNARTWGELNKNLLYALSLEKTVMVLVLSLIIIISGFVVAVILNTLVKEKTKDIGILRAIGFSRSKIMNIFMIEGMFFGLLGIILGVTFSLIIIHILKNTSIIPLDAYYLDKLPVEIGFKDFLYIISATIFVTFISSVYPAYKASTLLPVEALRNE